MTPRVSWKLNLAMLWFSQLLIMAGYQALIPFVPLFIKNNLGVTDSTALAVAVAAFNFFGTMGYAIFNPIWGMLADKFGVKPMLLRGTFLTGLIFPLMAYSPTVTILVVLRFISAGCAGTTAASQTMIVRTTPDDKQGFALGVLTTAIWGGAMLGNVVGGLLIHYFNYTVAFWVCGIMYIAGGISILFTRDEVVKKTSVLTQTSSRSNKYLPHFSRGVWILLALFLFFGLVRNFEVPYIALRVEELSSKEAAAFWTGIISGIVCVAAIISGVVSGYLVDRVPAGKIMIPAVIFCVIGLLWQGFADNMFSFTIGRVILYTASGGLHPILQKVLSSATPQRKRGGVFGFSSSCLSLGGMAAAVASGFAMNYCGLSGVFYIAAVLFAVFLPFVLAGISSAMRPFHFHRR